MTPAQKAVNDEICAARFTPGQGKACGSQPPVCK
jgi:hypothetical protein